MTTLNNNSNHTANNDGDDNCSNSVSTVNHKACADNYGNYTPNFYSNYNLTPTECSMCHENGWCSKMHRSLRRIKKWSKENQKKEKVPRRLPGGGLPPAPIPEHIQPHLKGFNRWDFDIFKLNDVSDNNSLKFVGFEIFNRYGMLDRFKIPHSILEKFLIQLQVGYSKHNNPYHNLIHGADVAQTCSWMISQTGLNEVLSELEVFACLFSSMIHDYEHTGHTNNFHVQSYSDFALLYNDRSVLENHHISSCFKMLKENDKNILAYLNKEEFREFRNLVVEIVLATDMSTHFPQIKTMKSMLNLPENINKVKAMCYLVHCCDISHPAKPWNLHYKWSLHVTEEFFRQGDLEASLGLPFSPLCDRNSVHMAESQIGFIDFIVEPSMMVCGEMLLKMVEPLVAMPAMPKEAEAGSKSKHQHNEAVLRGEAVVESTSRSGGSKPSSLTRSKLTFSSDGKLNIPQPWIADMQNNKLKWKEQATLGRQKPGKSDLVKSIPAKTSFEKNWSGKIAPEKTVEKKQARKEP